MEAATAVLQLVQAVLKKKDQIVSLYEETHQFCALLESIETILRDVTASLAQDDVVEKNTTVRQPLKDLMRAIKEGNEVIDECTKTSKLKTGLFSHSYLSKLRKSSEGISKALTNLQFAGISLQAESLTRISQVKQNVETLQMTIDSYHNEIVDILKDQGTAIQVLVSMNLATNGQDFLEQAREIADQAEEIRKVKGFHEEQILKWVQHISQIPLYLFCPISHLPMEDPVIVTESGISYDRKWLCESLLIHPDLEPFTGKRYDKKLVYSDNICLRQALMEQCGDQAYTRYDDSGFASKYDAAWKRQLKKDFSIVTVAKESHAMPAPSSSSPTTASTVSPAAEEEHVDDLFFCTSICSPICSSCSSLFYLLYSYSPSYSFFGY
jgi:U-box domain